MERIVVIGTSSGGLAALRGLIPALREIRTPVLVVQHIGSQRSILPDLLNTAQMPVSRASDGERLEAGRTLIAPSDAHLL